jgi:hypothetical protein
MKDPLLFFGNDRKSGRNFVNVIRHVTETAFAILGTKLPSHRRSGNNRIIFLYPVSDLFPIVLPGN